MLISLALVTWLTNYKLFYFGSVTQVGVMLEKRPQIIGKMTDFWRVIFSSIILLLATLCDTWKTNRKNHWLLRIIWSFSESVSEYKSVFRICVWLLIYEVLLWFYMNFLYLWFCCLLNLICKYSNQLFTLMNIINIIHYFSEGKIPKIKRLKQFSL